ncbi:hypothetical protein THS27_03175 [Thalassospira sp. MCCC 1A01428]|nr:hypothetical protein THS27_03175 [Thalassospira sp. MCCC 1A01428]
MQEGTAELCKIGRLFARFVKFRYALRDFAIKIIAIADFMFFTIQYSQFALSIVAMVYFSFKWGRN